MIEEDKLNALELFGENEYLHKEIERLHSIIKEVRGYVNRIMESENNINPYILHAPTLLEILDKENK